MVFRLGVFSTIERFDFVDFAKRSAVGSGAKKHARDGKLTASPAIQTFATASFVDRENGTECPFDFGIPIVFVEGGHIYMSGKH